MVAARRILFFPRAHRGERASSINHRTLPAMATILPATRNLFGNLCRRGFARERADGRQLRLSRSQTGASIPARPLLRKALALRGTDSPRRLPDFSRIVLALVDLGLISKCER